MFCSRRNGPCRTLALWLTALILLGTATAASPQASSAVPAVSTEDLLAYRLGPEDVVTVTVLRHPEFSGDFLLTDSGVIQIPAVGDVHAAGMTLAELASFVTAKLGDRLWKPEVTATLKTARQRRVYVVGDVKLSGVYDWKPGWTIAQLLSSAGGLDVGVDRNDVQIVLETASGEISARLPLREALDNPKEPKLRVQPGDTLRVEATGTLPVYVSGQVIRPGLYRLREDSASVLSAISEAGGLTPDASYSVKIEKLSGAEVSVDLTPALVLGQKSSIPRLDAGDMVIIAENLQRFSVLGFVTKPGLYPIEGGRIYRLTDALASAEGAGTLVGQRGSVFRIGLVRTDKGIVTSRVCDLSKFLKKGDLSQNPVIAPGDVVYVPKSNAIELDTILTGITAAAVLYYDLHN
jgi:polysaccharide biosynthesis/export protein